jgi:PadR family transcriptional regulator PadR
MDAILLRLVLERDRYGYELFNEIETRTAGRLSIKEATLYAALQRLERQRCVSSYQGEISGGSKRRYYHITPAGKELLVKLKATWQELKEILTIFMED